MSDKEYKSISEFYPYYLTEHKLPMTRLLHFVGTALLLVSFLTFLITLNWSFLIAVPFIGYGFAWVGHFFFEKNKPATFKYPGYSLGSDFIMFWQLLTRQIGFDGRK
ncbi:MAG: DUF962 domain-containing protein [Flavobacteriia bacterium]|nr:DUF962 domain-containing protein [Flavobacteriia bacterium]